MIPMLALSLVLPLAAPPSLLIGGKPQPGGELRIFVEGITEPGFLVLDPQAGSAQVGGVQLGVAMSAQAQSIVLPAAPGAFSEVLWPVPGDPAVIGTSLFVEAYSPAQGATTGAIEVTFGEAPPIGGVDDYCYQLQGKNGKKLKLEPIAATAFDLCIVDYSRDGKDEFTPAEVAALRSPAEPDRIRLAYFSIGEAEDYRFYWKKMSQSLLAGANPQWAGNFKVKYWRDEWREILIDGNTEIGASYLDRIIDQGFDGVYLDVVDAFEFFGPKQAGGKDLKRDAAAQLARLVLEIAHHARVVRGKAGFLIVPQNGSNVIDAEWYPQDALDADDAATPALAAALWRDRLFATVDAIGVEDTFFYGPQDEDNKLKPQGYLLSMLAQWTAAGLPVLATEYLTKPGKKSKLYQDLAPANGFVPYATVRDLDAPVISAGFEPD